MKTIVGQEVWAHRPRGGFVTGYATKEKSGLYGPERGIARTPEEAIAGEFFTSVPTNQINLGKPPYKVEFPKCRHDNSLSCL